jgi:3-phenylpropionate/cinnamic acid dioxygenase small subunit
MASLVPHEQKTLEPGSKAASSRVRRRCRTISAWLTEESTVFAGIYAEVQNFYAMHMHLLDGGQAEEWGEGFTADGTFTLPSQPEPARGRADIVAGAQKSIAELAAANETRRHLLSMVAVEPQADGSLKVRSYAQIIATPRDGTSRLHVMCVCEDLLVRENGELRLHERRVTRDDRP